MSKKWRYEGAETHCHPIVVTRLDSLVYSIGGGQLPAAPPARARARRRGRRSREAATPNARHDARSRIVNVRETRTDGDAPVDARLRGARARARRSRGIYHILRGDVHARRAYPGSRPHFFRSRILELPPRFPTATAGTPRAEAAKIKLFAGSAGAVWAYRKVEFMCKTFKRHASGMLGSRPLIFGVWFPVLSSHK